MKTVSEMSTIELEEEYEQNKSISQKFIEKDIRALDVNSELLRRFKHLKNPYSPSNQNY